MTHWPIQDAKARFSQMLNQCLSEGPQIVTRRGKNAAVLVPIDEWQRLNRLARASLKSLLLAEAPRAEIPIPKRGKLRRRPPREFV